MAAPATKKAPVDTSVLTEDADNFTIEERAYTYFNDQKNLIAEKIRRREATVAEARRHDAKDPNIVGDLDFIELHKAMLRGIEDALAGVRKRAESERSKLAAKVEA